MRKILEIRFNENLYLLFILVFLLVLTNGNLYSQKRKPLNNKSVIKVDITSITSSFFTNDEPIYSVAIERAVNRNMSVNLGFTIGRFREIEAASATCSGTYNNLNCVTTSYKLSYDGYAITPEFRYFPFTANKPAPKGYFIGSYMKYLHLDREYKSGGYTTDMDGGDIYGMGICTGYKFFKRRYHLELVAGFAAGKATGFKEKTSQDILDFSNSDKYLFLSNFAFNFCYSF